MQRGGPCFHTAAVGFTLRGLIAIPYSRADVA